MPIPILRAASPRLYHPADDPDSRFDLPRDPVRRRILKNILADCEGYASQGPWRRILSVRWAGHPLLTTISSEEARPVSCGSLPCVGGQNELVATLGRLKAEKGFDRP